MFRYFHTSKSAWVVSKSALSALRKKTGYTFANCRKALELHDNDLSKAEEWLKAQAKELGWEKAAKLEGRPTAQGLIGVAVSENKAVMVEINCETDFVARNLKFRSLVELAAASCLHYDFPSQTLLSEEIKRITDNNGIPLADHLALTIGSLGENLVARRAYNFTLSEGLKVAGFTHPPPEQSSKILLGKYGALVAFTEPANNAVSSTDLGRQLCQHVIGMNPIKVGQLDVDVAAEDKDLETVMVHQEFLLDPAITVGQLLADCGSAVVAFKRYECGESDVAAEDINEAETLRAEG